MLRLCSLATNSSFNGLSNRYDPQRIPFVYRDCSRNIFGNRSHFSIDTFTAGKQKFLRLKPFAQNVDVNTKGRDVKTSGLTYKLFGISGMLASKYYKRSRTKCRATILSLFMSIVLFVSAFSFTDYLMESVTGGFSQENYDISFSYNNNNMEEPV